jgi:hypothetical protein
MREILEEFNRPRTAKKRRSPMRAASSGDCVGGTLDNADQRQNNEDHQNRAEPAGRIIAPTRAIGPRWERADH